MNAHNNDSSSSDSSDEDYCPETLREDLSEESSDDPCQDDSENEIKKKRTKKCKAKHTKRKKVDEIENDESVSTTETSNINEEEKKKKADSLWADFLSDTGTKLKPKINNTKTEDKVLKIDKPKLKEKKVITVTDIFDFAGEKVKVTKEVAVDSVEARLSTSNSTDTSPNKNENSKFVPKKSGMQSILGQINKKNKISTLEKSKLDWDSFKKKQGLEEEIQNHNKGKNGYLEKQDFLQRADLRQFEIEKEFRTAKRNNRLN